MQKSGIYIPVDYGDHYVCDFYPHNAAVPQGGRGGGEDRGHGVKNAVCGSAHAGLFDHRQYADTVHRLQFPGHDHGHRKAGLFFIPAILILPGLLGIPGLQLAQPVADLLTFILTQVIVVMVAKELREMDVNMKKKEPAEHV